MSYEIKFSPEKFKGTLADELRRRMARAGIAVERNIKRSMPSGGFGKTHTPSPPGSPPAVDTGRLKSSITYAVTDGQFSSPSGANAVPEDGIGKVSGSDNDIFVVVGTNTKYAPPLEFGYSRSMVKKNGEEIVITMSPRPFLRPGLENSVADIKSVFSKK